MQSHCLLEYVDVKLQASQSPPCFSIHTGAEMSFKYTI